MSRGQLALSVTDIDGAVVFYRVQYTLDPPQRRFPSADFAVVDLTRTPTVIGCGGARIREVTGAPRDVYALLAGACSEARSSAAGGCGAQDATPRMDPMSAALCCATP